MALNKNERRALELARERIKELRQDHLCTALAGVMGSESDLYDAAGRLQQYIHESLNDGHSMSLYLEDWQRKNGFSVRDKEQRRADRLAWIDWMLGKPLAGEVVEIEWQHTEVWERRAEYCGRKFIAYRPVYQSQWQIEEEGAPFGSFATGLRHSELTAAVVAHVWPALPPDEPRHV